MQSIFHITGGLGKHVLFSAVLNSYKQTYPEREVIVSCAYPEIYEKNPNISESLNLNKNQYFYKNYIHNKDVEIFAQEPYKQSSHLLKEKHLIETWCSMLKIDYVSPPSIHLNFREIEYVGKRMSNYGNKPILVFQPFGGMENHESPYCWARDIHPSLAQKIVDSLHEKYNILHICNSVHPTLNNCIRIDEKLHPNILFSILKFSSARILIDSCLQHAAAAMSLPSIVFWGVTNPEQFGYTLHTNILPKNTSLTGINSSYLFNYEIGGIITECPYTDPNDIYDNQEIEAIISNLS